jgi:glycosyltransferase involved in cell wall biosynthesis
MAASLPIVATDVGSNSELVVNGKAGFVVPSEDLEGLVSHLEWTTHHREECKKMGALGKAFVADKYSFAHTTKAYDTIFKMVLQGKTKKK